MMNAGLNIQGIQSVRATLHKMGQKAREASQAEARVGYTAEYALFVHEIKKNYRNGKQWKYLETPVRQLNNSGELGRIIRTSVQAGAPLEQSLFLAALRILRESQRIVPMDTGHLKASGFVQKGL